MEHRRLGDRWLAGEAIDGVRFARHDTIRISAGRFAGRLGTIALLLSPPPDPLYLIELREGGDDVRVRQNALQSVT